jgi:hypothetical protein
LLVRNLILGEELPKEITTGYEQCQCDPKWIWICEYNGKPIGILVTAPAHIAVILLRFVMVEESPAVGAGKLLTDAFKEMAARGYRGYIVWFGEGTQVEGQLLKLVESSGGGVLEKSMSLCYGRFERKEAA